VRLEKEKHQKTTKVELPQGRKGEALRNLRSDETLTAANRNQRLGNDEMMEKIVERSNVVKALKRVKQNKGSAGVDGMSVEELSTHLNENWETIRRSLLEGKYQPKQVRGQEIPKSDGGIRKLGIPTVLDRLIQQCILQVLQPIEEPTFSKHSYGFRPGRNAHQAVCEAQKYIQEGKRVVVDVDLEKFFDRVNHDVLMGKLAKRIGDKRLLKLIRKYLEAGVMANGVVMERNEGTPQGGPLSPLLANVMLDEVDKELEKRGLSFVRYADDLNVYVKSTRAGEDAMETLKNLYGKLKLKINESKSAVTAPWKRKFLGYSFWMGPGKTIKPRVANEAIVRMKKKVKLITSRSGGRSIETVIAELKVYLTGWKNYFQLAQTPKVMRGIDGWIRHRMRALQLKQWKSGKTAYREVRQLGASHDVAAQAASNTKSWWRTASRMLHAVLTIEYYDARGLTRLAN
jgi:RNA-directed DNA polymerase